MTTIDTPVRSPTNRAWALTAATLIASGELFLLGRRGSALTLFDVTFAPPTLIGVAMPLGLVAIVSLVWLVSLYRRPGRLLVDLEGGRLRRELRPLLVRHVIEAPLVEWRIQLVFYSQHTRRLGSFKRLELAGPRGLEEVIFFTDVPKGERLARDLEQLCFVECDFEIVIERERDSRAR